jgi:BASS family bile acid:Na+ symporter
MRCASQIIAELYPAAHPAIAHFQAQATIAGKAATVDLWAMPLAPLGHKGKQVPTGFGKPTSGSKAGDSMELVTIVKLAAVASIFLLVLSFGMETRLADAFAFLKAPAESFRAMAAMYLVVPAVALGLALWLPLVPATMFALLALAVSPMPPIFPGKGAKVGGGNRYVMSLFVLATMVTFVAAPIIVAIDSRVLGVGLSFDARHVLIVVGLTVVIPLAAGLALSAVAPAFAARSAHPLALAGKALLAVTLLAALVVTAPNMLEAVGNFTLVACFVMAAAALFAGHLLGGPALGNRAALATAATLRHPGVALALAATASSSDSKQVTATVLLYLIIATLIGIPYDRWIKARIARG